MNRVLGIAWVVTLLATGWAAAQPSAGQVPSSSTTRSVPDSLERADLLYLDRDLGDNFQESMRILWRLKASGADSAGVPWRLARGLFWMGDRTRNDEDKRRRAYEMGVDLARQSLELNPDLPEAHFWLAMNYGGLAHHSGIFTTYRLAKKIQEEMGILHKIAPQNSAAYHVCGVILRKLPGLVGGSTDKAIEELRRAVSLAPDCPPHHFELAKAYLQAKRYAEARDELRAFEHASGNCDPAATRTELAELPRLLKTLEKK